MKAKAPGKLILSGEHSVVYGAPAIAFSVDRSVTSTFIPDRSDTLTIKSAGVGVYSASLDEIDQLAQRLDERFDRFFKGDLSIKALLSSPGELLFYSLAQFPVRQGGSFNISSTIPVGSGMGSSAAVIAALLKLSEHLSANDPLPEISFCERVRYCERLQHGRGSLIDAAATTFGGVVRIEGSSVAPLNFSLGSGWYRCHTGVPEESTGEIVAHVRRRHHRSEIWSEFADLTTQWREGLSPKETLKLIRQNHRLLANIGVVPENISQLINKVERFGGAAKICGAGACKGDRAGTLLIYLPEQPASAIEAQLGVELIPLKPTNQGVCLAED